MTTPVAWVTAAASAGAVQSKAPSLTPFDPYGPGPSSFSTLSASNVSGTSFVDRDPIVERTKIADASFVIKDDMLH
jgi:hypothetical protein